MEHVFSEEFKEIVSFHYPSSAFPSISNQEPYEDKRVPSAFTYALQTVQRYYQHPELSKETHRAVVCILLYRYFLTASLHTGKHCCTPCCPPSASTEPSELCNMDTCIQGPTRDNPHMLIPALTLKWVCEMKLPPSKLCTRDAVLGKANKI